MTITRAVGAAGMALAALLMAAPAHAAWVPPYVPVSPGVILRLQGVLRSDMGMKMCVVYPSLRMIRGLDPESETHRRIVGAMDLPAAISAQALVEAYLRAMPRVEAVVASRAKDIAEAVAKKEMSAKELVAAADDLTAFSFYGDRVQAEVKPIEDLARAARSAKTMDAAREIASRLASR